MNGTFAAADAAINSEGAERAGGIINLIATPVMDGLTGKAASSALKGKPRAKAGMAEDVGPNPRAAPKNGLKGAGKKIVKAGKVVAHLSLHEF